MALTLQATFTTTENPPAGFVAAGANGIEASGGIGVAVDPGAIAAMSYNTLLNADQEAAFDLNFTSFATVEIFAKAQSATDLTASRYSVRYTKVAGNAPDTMSILKWVSGSPTTLVTSNLKRGKIASADQLKIRAFDAGTVTVIQSWANGILVDEYVDSASPIQGTGYVGAWLDANSSGMGIDNFYAGNLTVKWVCPSGGTTSPTQSPGNDGNAGTFAAPWLTAKRGVRSDTGLTAAGQLLVIRGMDTTETLRDEFDSFTWRPGTDWNNPTTHQAFPGETVRFTQSGSVGSVMTFTQDPAGYFYNKYIQTIGIDFDCGATPTTGPNEAVLVRGSEYIRFQRCDVSHARLVGFRLSQVLVSQATERDNNHYELLECNIHDQVTEHGAYNVAHGTLIEDCDIHHNDRVGVWNNTVATPTDSDILQGKGAILRRNRIHHNGSQGSGCKGYNDVLWLSNLIYRNGNDGIDVFQTSGTLANDKGPCTDCLAYNNTIYANGITSHYGIRVQSGAVGTLIKNNILYLNESKGVFDAGTGTVLANNLNPTTGTETDPLFVSETLDAEDFHLQAGSPCIGAGANLGTAYNIDFDGNTRPASGGWSQGAYEYQITASGVIKRQRQPAFSMGFGF